MLTYKEILTPFKLKKKGNAETSICPFCGKGKLYIKTGLFACDNCSFIGNETFFLSKFNSNLDIDKLIKLSNEQSTENHDQKENLPSDNTETTYQINDEKRPIFLVFSKTLFNHLRTLYSKINVILNPNLSDKLLEGKILYYCSLNVEHIRMLYQVTRYLKIIEPERLMSCHNEESLRKTITSIDFYEPYPILDLIIVDDLEMYKYLNSIRFNVVLSKKSSVSLIKENDCVIFLCSTNDLSLIASVINPFFKKTQNIFYFYYQKIKIPEKIDNITRERQFFCIFLKHIIYNHFISLVETSFIKKRKNETTQKVIDEMFSAKNLIETDISVNNFLNLLNNKYSEIVSLYI